MFHHAVCVSLDILHFLTPRVDAILSAFRNISLNYPLHENRTLLWYPEPDLDEFLPPPFFSFCLDSEAKAWIGSPNCSTFIKKFKCVRPFVCSKTPKVHKYCKSRKRSLRALFFATGDVKHNLKNRQKIGIRIRLQLKPKVRVGALTVRKNIYN